MGCPKRRNTGGEAPGTGVTGIKRPSRKLRRCTWTTMNFGGKWRRLDGNWIDRPTTAKTTMMTRLPSDRLPTCTLPSTSQCRCHTSVQHSGTVLKARDRSLPGHLKNNTWIDLQWNHRQLDRKRNSTLNVLLPYARHLDQTRSCSRPAHLQITAQPERWHRVSLRNPWPNPPSRSE